MHLQLFGLSEPPFSASPDTRFIYLCERRAAALAVMRRGLADRDTVDILTGEPGAGKTTLLRAFLSGLDEDVLVAEISEPGLDEAALLQAVLTGFGFDPVEASVEELRNIIRVFLVHALSRQCAAVMVVEDGQRMSAHALECVSWLASLEHDGENLLNVLLAGPPELHRIVDSPGMGELCARTRVRLEVAPFDAAGTRAYIDHRVAAAGSRASLFSDQAIAAVHEHSGGLPRSIDTLCAAALEAASERRAPRVTAEAVMSAASSFAPRIAAPPDTTTWPLVPPPGALLRVSLDGVPLAEYPLAGERVIAGRHEDCDIQLEGRFISRHHAMLVRTRGGYCLLDLNSTNGTYVNGRRITQCLLHDHDVVQIGSHHVKFRIQAREAAEREPLTDHAKTDVFEPADGKRPARVAQHAGSRARLFSVR